MSTGAASLVLAIVLAGYVGLIASSVIGWWRDRNINHLRQGNKLIRRELQRHGDDDGR